MFNREAAIEIEMTPALNNVITQHFSLTDQPFGLAIEVDGFVISAPLLVRPPVADRLVVAGGFSIDSALALAATLNDR